MDTTIASLIGEEPFDLTIRGGRIVTDGRVVEGDLGVRDGRIAAIGGSLPPGRRDVDATGRWVLPGGIDSHCHVEQRSGMGMMCADDFYSATVSAAFGGTTTILPFAAQHREMSVPEVLADYSRRAAEKAVIDYGFHLILANPDDATLSTDLPAAIRDGITSLKVYMTYDRMKLEDYQLLEVLALARAEGALVMVHAENNDMIRWIAQRLIDRGHTAPKFHGVAHDPLAETEAAYRAIALARLVDVPLLLVHVAGGDTVEVIRQAQTLGANVLAESCPQYLFLTAEDLGIDDSYHGAKCVCSPPPRDKANQEVIWNGLRDGLFTVFSSDHAPCKIDGPGGKHPNGEEVAFRHIPNGIPGLETRMPLLYSEGVLKGRISLEKFVELTATGPAKTYGIHPRKGAICIGADADLVIWDERELTIRNSALHHAVDYTPYEGMQLGAWPAFTLLRGEVLWDGSACVGPRNQGRFIAAGRPSILPPAHLAAA